MVEDGPTMNKYLQQPGHHGHLAAQFLFYYAQEIKYVIFLLFYNRRNDRFKLRCPKIILTIRNVLKSELFK